MPITVQEKYRGRRRATGRNAYAEIAYLLFGEDRTEDDDDAEEALLEEAPAQYAGMPFEGIGSLEEVHTGDEEDRPVWEATVRYGLATRDIPFREPGTNQLSFRTTGGTTHIQTSQFTNWYKRPGKTAIDFRNAIGVTPGGGVQGTDIVVPIFEWRETWVFTDTQITPAFVRDLYELTGTVNKDPWRVFDAEETLFMGVEGSQRGDTNWELTYYLAAAKTLLIPSIGDIRASDGGPIEKKGWDYLWVYYREDAITITGTEKILIPVPIQVNVEAVYDLGLFPRLGIGV